MADRVELAFDRAFRALVPRGSRVLAAVSGGGDSTALVRLLARLAVRGEIELVVAHLDHGLRRGSAKDRRFVARLAADLGVPCVADRRPVKTLRRKDESPEEAARRVRRAFLVESARATRATHIALGHTLDDQAETILMRLCRGGGPSSLGGMAASGPGLLVRPLLGMERSELRGYLRRRRFESIEDPSNEDPRHLRNRVRHEVLPLLAEVVNPGAARHLVQAAARIREDAALLDRLAARWLEQEGGRRGRVVLAAKGLTQLEAPLAGRVVLGALERAGADPRRLTAKHVAAVLRLAASERPGSLDLPGLTAVRRGDSVTLRASKRA